MGFFFLTVNKIDKISILWPEKEKGTRASCKITSLVTHAVLVLWLRGKQQYRKWKKEKLFPLKTITHKRINSDKSVLVFFFFSLSVNKIDKIYTLWPEKEKGTKASCKITSLVTHAVLVWWLRMKKQYRKWKKEKLFPLKPITHKINILPFFVFETKIFLLSR